MKKYLFWLLAGTGLLCCKSSGLDKKEEGLKYKETVIINDVPKATLTFFEVTDSRCPENVNCIWAGNVIVDLLLSGVTTEGGLNERIKLCSGTCGGTFGEDTLVRKFAGEEYRLILQEVKPPSRNDQTKKEEYSILLKIEKQ